MRFSTTILFAISIFLWPSIAMSQSGEPPAKNPADAGKKLRLMALGLTPHQAGIKPSPEFPNVFGVVMDWPLDNGLVITVVSLADGNASLYTTSTFGIIGGFSHESVSKAAKSFVKMSDQLVGDSTLTKDCSYPTAGRVKFYLLTFQGLKVINGDLASISTGKDKYSDLFGRAQTVITELRKISEEKP